MFFPANIVFPNYDFPKYDFPKYVFPNYDYQFLTQSNTDLFELTEEAER